MSESSHVVFEVAEYSQKPAFLDFEQPGARLYIVGLDHFEYPLVNEGIFFVEYEEGGDEIVVFFAKDGWAEETTVVDVHDGLFLAVLVDAGDIIGFGDNPAVVEIGRKQLWDQIVEDEGVVYREESLHFDEWVSFPEVL